MEGKLNQGGAFILQVWYWKTLSRMH